MINFGTIKNWLKTGLNTSFFPHCFRGEEKRGKNNHFVICRPKIIYPKNYNSYNVLPSFLHFNLFLPKIYNY